MGETRLLLTDGRKAIEPVEILRPGQYSRAEMQQLLNLMVDRVIREEFDRLMRDVMYSPGRPGRY